MKKLEKLNLFLKRPCSFSDYLQAVFRDSSQKCSINAVPREVCVSSLADRPDGMFAKSLGSSEPINDICGANQLNLVTGRNHHVIQAAESD